VRVPVGQAFRPGVLGLATALIWIVEVAGQSAPRRIVSLVPAVTEMLFALGAGDRVVGVSNFDKFPPEVTKIAQVGALLDPNLDRILSLKPDLVVVYYSQTDLQTQLQRATVASFSYKHAGLADVTDTLRAVGARIGRAEQARVIATEIESKIAALRKRYASGARPKTLVVFGRENFALRGIYASGGRGFVHDMLTVAGGENVFADVDREAVQATTELILARRPEVIIELRADPMTAEAERKEVTTWNQLASLPAVRAKRVHIITDPRTVIPGPRVVDGVEIIAERIHQQVATKY
jgi:iron complex transport system substrate-binding protein